MKKVLLPVVLTLAALPAFAELTPGTPAPEFPRDAIWLGTGGRSLTMRQLRGRVVLVDFWEYTCINCIRTFPHLKEWWARYHAAGLEIVGVHKGEFAFASREENVARAYERFRLPYPAIADVRDEVWRAYDCNSWPESFLIDRAGIIRELHQGEGDYGKLEREIQNLLGQGRPGLDFSKLAIPPDRPAAGNGCGDQSPEIYVGYERGAIWGGRIANPEGFRKNRVVVYAPTENRVIRGFFAEGAWRNRPDDFESAADPAPGRPVSLGISYRGRDVYAVLGRGTDVKEPVEVVVTRDGKPIPGRMRGKDIEVNAKGQTIVVIDEPRMYYLVTKEEPRTHELALFPQKAGARVCSFTFGNKCLEDFERL